MCRRRAGTAHRIAPLDRLSTAQRPRHIVALGQRERRRPDVPVEPEDGIHEPIRSGVDLPLRQRPQLDGLGAPRQRIRQAKLPQLS